MMRLDNPIPDATELDAAQTLTAVTALFADDGIASHAATRAISSLLSRPDDWVAIAEQLSLGNLLARYARGPLASIFSEPCELVLARHPAGGFQLLHHQEPHWCTIDANGEVSGTIRESDIAHGRQDVEMIFLRLPHDRNGAVTALSQLWPMLQRSWMEIGLASLFVNGGMLLLPLFSMLVYDKVVNNGIFETLWALVTGILVYLFMDTGMRIVRAWSVEQIANRLSQESDERLWHRLLAQKDFSGGSFASFLAEYRNLAASRDFVSASYLMGVVDLPFFLLFLLAIGFIAWPLLILVLVLASFYALAAMTLHSQVIELSKEAEKSGIRKLAFMSETLNTLDVARTVPAPHFLLRRWRSLVAETATLEARRRLTASHSSTLAVGMTTLATVATLTVGAYLIDARMLTVGGLIAAGMLATRTMALVASLFAMLSKWEEFRRATAILEAALDPPRESAQLDKPQTAGRIDVLGVRREYKGRPLALDAVTLNIEPGSRIALLGRPGSGKSTLLRCLAGLTPPDAGQILIDGIAIDDIAPKDRARWLVYKAQEPALFAGTLDENLRISGCSPESPRFAQAIWASGLEEELRSGRMTLGMSLAERGCNLSGGQRQKVALARAFAQGGRILLLDEPTLGLDAEGERLLAERLPQILDDGVLVASTHCATMLQTVSRIIVIDSGRVVTDGPKERLLRTEQKAV